MPQLKKFGNPIRTRLLDGDCHLFRKLARERHMNDASFARYCILSFIQQIDRFEQSTAETDSVAAIKSSTNRICSFLARIAADVRATYMFVGEDDPERIKKWRAAALRQIVAKLPPEDAELARRLIENTSPPLEQQS